MCVRKHKSNHFCFRQFSLRGQWIQDFILVRESGFVTPLCCFSNALINAPRGKTIRYSIRTKQNSNCHLTLSFWLILSCNFEVNARNSFRSLEIVRKMICFISMVISMFFAAKEAAQNRYEASRRLHSNKGRWNVKSKSRIFNNRQESFLIAYSLR